VVLPRLAISLGDPSGIGAEVTAAALVQLRTEVVPLLFGDPGLLSRGISRLRLPVIEPGQRFPAGGALVAISRLAPSELEAGRPSAAGARAQLDYFAAAFDAVRAGQAAALCTAPVSKAQVASVLPGFVGHTEWLEARCQVRRTVMMLAGQRLKVALVTNHRPLSEVRRALTPALIAETIAITWRALRDDLGVASPRVALAGWNPHAGDGGLVGDEELTLLAPALRLARRRGTPAQGPFPADSVFFRAALGEFDAVVALYHDQGLIPVKLLDAVTGDPAVNVTLGLPMVRTSPDHGVAYSLAGTGRASPASMVAALRLAARIAQVRAKAARA
jgi:4-hydroxythreonine-4-phosphate dehydrogenase